MFYNFRDVADGDDFAAVHARAGAEVDDGVRAPHRLLVVLHDHERVALGAQRFEGGQQLLVVARVQADGRLVEHVENAAQVGAELGRQPDALGFAAAQRLGRAVQPEVVEPHASHEFQPLPNLRQNVGADEFLARVEFDFAKLRERFADGEMHKRAERPVLEPDIARDLVEPRSVALGAALRFAFFEPFVAAFLVHLGLQRRVGFRSRAFPDFAKAVAEFAPAVRGVEREQARVEFLERFATAGAAHFRAQHRELPVGVAQSRGAFADLQRAPEDLLQPTGRTPLAHHHVDGVFAEAFEALEIRHANEPSIHEEFFKPLARRPARHFAVESFAGFDERGQHADAAPFAHGGFRLFQDGGEALFLHRQLAFRAVLRAEF